MTALLSYFMLSQTKKGLHIIYPIGVCMVFIFRDCTYEHANAICVHLKCNVYDHMPKPQTHLLWAMPNSRKKTVVEFCSMHSLEILREKVST